MLISIIILTFSKIHEATVQKVNVNQNEEEYNINDPYNCFSLDKQEHLQTIITTNIHPTTQECAKIDDLHVSGSNGSENPVIGIKTSIPFVSEFETIKNNKNSSSLDEVLQNNHEDFLIALDFVDRKLKEEFNVKNFAVISQEGQSTYTEDNHYGENYCNTFGFSHTNIENRKTYDSIGENNHYYENYPDFPSDTASLKISSIPVGHDSDHLSPNPSENFRENYQRSNDIIVPKSDSVVEHFVKTQNNCDLSHNDSQKKLEIINLDSMKGNNSSSNDESIILNHNVHENVISVEFDLKEECGPLIENHNVHENVISAEFDSKEDCGPLIENHNVHENVISAEFDSKEDCGPLIENHNVHENVISAEFDLKEECGSLIENQNHEQSTILEPLDLSRKFLCSNTNLKNNKEIFNSSTHHSITKDMLSNKDENKYFVDKTQQSFPFVASNSKLKAKTKITDEDNLLEDQIIEDNSSVDSLSLKKGESSINIRDDKQKTNFGTFIRKKEFVYLIQNKNITTKYGIEPSTDSLHNDLVEDTYSPNDYYGVTLSKNKKNMLYSNSYSTKRIDFYKEDQNNMFNEDGCTSTTMKLEPINRTGCFTMSKNIILPDRNLTPDQFIIHESKNLNSNQNATTDESNQQKSNGTTPNILVRDFANESLTQTTFNEVDELQMKHIFKRKMLPENSHHSTKINSKFNSSKQSKNNKSGSNLNPNPPNSLLKINHPSYIRHLDPELTTIHHRLDKRKIAESSESEQSDINDIKIHRKNFVNSCSSISGHFCKEKEHKIDRSTKTNSCIQYTNGKNDVNIDIKTPLIYNTENTSFLVLETYVGKNKPSDITDNNLYKNINTNHIVPVFEKHEKVMVRVGNNHVKTSNENGIKKKESADNVENTITKSYLVEEKGSCETKKQKQNNVINDKCNKNTNEIFEININIGIMNLENKSSEILTDGKLTADNKKNNNINEKRLEKLESCLNENSTEADNVDSRNRVLYNPERKSKNSCQYKCRKVINIQKSEIENPIFPEKNKTSKIKENAYKIIENKNEKQVKARKMKNNNTKHCANEIANSIPVDHNNSRKRKSDTFSNAYDKKIKIEKLISKTIKKDCDNTPHCSHQIALKDKIDNKTDNYINELAIIIFKALKINCGLEIEIDEIEGFLEFKKFFLKSNSEEKTRNWIEILKAGLKIYMKKTNLNATEILKIHLDIIIKKNKSKLPEIYILKESKFIEKIMAITNKEKKNIIYLIILSISNIISLKNFDIEVFKKLCDKISTECGKILRKTKKNINCLTEVSEKEKIEMFCLSDEEATKYNENKYIIRKLLLILFDIIGENRTQLKVYKILIDKEHKSFFENIDMDELYKCIFKKLAFYDWFFLILFHLDGEEVNTFFHCNSIKTEGQIKDDLDKIVGRILSFNSHFLSNCVRVEITLFYLLKTIEEYSSSHPFSSYPDNIKSIVNKYKDHLSASKSSKEFSEKIKKYNYVKDLNKIFHILDATNGI